VLTAWRCLCDRVVSCAGSFVTVVNGDSTTLTAGESLTLKPQLRDQFGNASAAAPDEFVSFVKTPDGEHRLELRQLKGLGLYEVSYDVTIKGSYYVHFRLAGQDIAGSPVEYTVSPGPALGTKSRLYPPPESPIIGQPCELLLEAIDKYGNKLDRGGARIDARANGPGVSACTAEDRGDGTYKVSFTAAVVGETRVIVRLDNVEMAPLKLLFIDAGKAVKGGGGKGGEASKDESAEAAVVLQE
jgi:hypothetical protein